MSLIIISYFISRFDKKGIIKERLKQNKMLAKLHARLF